MLDLMAAGVNFESMDPSALAAELAKATAARAAAQSLRRPGSGVDVQLDSPKALVSARSERPRVPSLRIPNPLVDRPMDSLRQSRHMDAAQAQAQGGEASASGRSAASWRAAASARAPEPNAVASFTPPHVPALSSFPRMAE
jgi:hypothetical protein